MAHCIQAIVAASSVADAICAAHSQLPRVRAPQGFAILPVGADFIDAVCQARPPQCTETFMLLTGGFYEFLRELSRLGPLAYIETDYFGGVGGQGAAVFFDRVVIMEPVWEAAGTINQALWLVGVTAQGCDYFAALGLDEYRLADDLLEAAARATDEDT